MTAAADDWKKYIPRYVVQIQSERSGISARELQLEAEARAMRRADLDDVVRHIPQADLDRLKRQMMPYATAPYWTNTSDGLAVVMKNWTFRGLPQRAAVAVWDMMQEDHRATRDTASDDLSNPAMPPEARSWRERALELFQRQYPNVVNINRGRGPGSHGVRNLGLPRRGARCPGQSEELDSLYEQDPCSNTWRHQGIPAATQGCEHPGQSRPLFSPAITAPPTRRTRHGLNSPRFFFVLTQTLAAFSVFAPRVPVKRAREESVLLMVG